MSREVRRVPLDYKHPVVLNPLWREHQRGRHVYTGPKMLKENERFVSMHDGSFFESVVEDFEKWHKSVSTRSGHTWDFNVRYYLTGFALNEGDEKQVHLFALEADDWRDDDLIEVRDEDHLQELLLSERNPESHRPEFDPERYMPSFADYDQDELGWCLYQTVSEGTPVTPVFATAEELVNHLVEYGTLADPPLRRESAESIVSTGYTVGSLFVAQGKLHSSTEDADVLAGTKRGD